MGQKVNPHGLRVGVIKDWDSKWYADADFADYLVEDYNIRTFLKKKLYAAGVSKIEIERTADRVKVILFTAKPGVVIGKGGAEIEKIKAKISFQEEIIDKNRRLKTGAYEDFRSDFISREEYKTFCARFDQQIKEAQDTIMQLTSEKNSVMGGLAEQQGWLSQFRQYENIQELTRRAVVNLIDFVRIRENKDIDVQLMHYDRFASIMEFLAEEKAKEDAKKIIRLTKEAV